MHFKGTIESATFKGRSKLGNNFILRVTGYKSVFKFNSQRRYSASALKGKSIQGKASPDLGFFSVLSYSFDRTASAELTRGMSKRY